MFSIYSIIWFTFHCYTSKPTNRTSSLLINKPKSEFKIKVNQESSLEVSFDFEYVEWLKLDFGVGSKTEIIYNENEGKSSVSIKSFKGFCMLSSEKPFKPVKPMKFPNYNGIIIEFIGDSNSEIISRDKPTDSAICIKQFSGNCSISSKSDLKRIPSFLFENTDEVFIYFVKDSNTRFVIKGRFGFNVLTKEFLYKHELEFTNLQSAIEKIK